MAYRLLRMAIVENNNNNEENSEMTRARKIRKRLSAIAGLGLVSGFGFTVVP